MGSVSPALQATKCTDLRAKAQRMIVDPDLRQRLA
jgi:hypothetical protein